LVSFVPFFFSLAVGSLNGPGVAMDDPLLVEKLRRYFLEPPPNPPVPLNLTNPDLADPSMGQSKVVRKLLDFQVRRHLMT